MSRCLSIRIQEPFTLEHIQEYGGKLKTLRALYAKLYRQKIIELSEVMLQKELINGTELMIY